jgi:two-component system, cell cycle response regulator DivK
MVNLWLMQRSNIKEFSMSTILLIEDNKDTARMVIKIMQPRNHTVIHAAAGLDGLKLARSEQPDLILVDMDLPDIEGKIVVHQLRAEPRFKDTPILAFTAENTPRAKRLALSFGCNDFIAKPIDTRTFPELLEQFLEIVAVNE